MVVSKQLVILAICWQLFSSALAIIIYLPLLLYRQLAILLNYVCYSDARRGQILPPRSGIYAVCDPYNETSCQGLIVSIITIKGLISESVLRSDFKSKVLTKPNVKNPNRLAYPELQHQLTRRFGYFFLVPAPDFCIAHHIRLCSPIASNPPTSQAEDLETLYESWLTKPFQRGTSPWEFLVFQAPDKNLTYLLFRMHHCLGDGFAITQLLVHDLCGLAKKLDGSAPTLKVQVQSSKLFRAAIRIPYDFVQQAIECYDSPNKIYKRKRASAAPAQFKIAVSDLIHINDVKRLKEAHPGSSFSAIVYAALTSALRQFYIKTYPSSKIPARIHVSVPVLFPRGTERIQNKHGFAILRLPIGTSDPLRQLEEINDWIARVKESTLPLTNAASFAVTGALPASLIDIVGRNRWTTALSSVFPGPRDELTFAGRFKVEEFSFSAGLLGFEQGIGFFALTYKDQFRIIASVDKRLCASKDAIRCIPQHAFQQLKLSSWT